MENEFRVSNELLASKTQRFINYIVDTIIIYTIIFLSMIITVIVCNLFGYGNIMGWFDTLDLGWYLIYFGFLISYYLVFEGLFSRSVAKFITKTIVVNRDGSKVNFGAIFKRTLCRIIPFDGFSYLGEYGRGWHDTIPNIYVVKKDLFEQKRALFYSFEEIGAKEEQLS